MQDSIDRIAAETAFSGVVRVARGGEVEFVKAYGLAHRGGGIPNEADTRFGIASGTLPLPSPCNDPVVFFTSGGGAWFAAAGG